MPRLGATGPWSRRPHASEAALTVPLVSAVLLLRRRRSCQSRWSPGRLCAVSADRDCPQASANERIIGSAGRHPSDRLGRTLWPDPRSDGVGEVGLDPVALHVGRRYGARDRRVRRVADIRSRPRCGVVPSGSHGQVRREWTTDWVLRVSDMTVGLAAHLTVCRDTGPGRTAPTPAGLRDWRTTFAWHR
jgi:hypothetical protein